MSHGTIAAAHTKFDIFDLLPMRGGIERILKILAVAGFNPIHQPVPNKIALLITHVIAAAVCITDETGGIEHQNHALRSIQNLLIKIALALQLRLKCSL